MANERSYAQASKVIRMNWKHLLAAAVVTVVASVTLTSVGSANELAVGTSSKVSGTISIPLRKPITLNGLTRDEVLKLRKQAVDANSNLLLYRYEPMREIFGQIVDKKPWWGMAGTILYGAGSRSTIGVSEESRFILNPYLLVGINSATIGIFDPSKFKPNDLNSDSFPYFWSPDSLVFEPRNKRAYATYNIQSYLQAISGTGKLKAPIKPNHFSLVAYNARDLGYRYIYLDTEESQNVKNSMDVDQPVHISQMIHCGGSCGYPGGCNNMSPFIKEIDRCYLTKVPAKAVIKLWKDRPYSSQEPDFVYVVDFK